MPDTVTRVPADVDGLHVRVGLSTLTTPRLMQVHRDGDLYSAMHCTGPTCIYLKLRLTETRKDAPDVIAGKPNLVTHYPLPSDGEIAASVLLGTDRANSTYNANLHPAEIWHSIDHYRPASCIEYIAFKLVEFGALPSFGPATQAAISGSSLSFHKLSAACGVSKSVLSQIAESASLDGVEQDVAVKLIEHFNLRADD